MVYIKLIKREQSYRFLLSRRLSARWVSRVNKIDWGDNQPEYIPVPDELILCDLCNDTFAEDPETEIPILQVTWNEGQTWEDIGTRCPRCMNEMLQLGEEPIPQVREDDET